MTMINLTKGTLQADFLATGDLYELSADGIMINQLNGNPLDGSLNQIWLRLHTDNGIQSAPLIGSNSNSRFSKGQDGLLWEGSFRQVAYQVCFLLGEGNCWFWQVCLEGNGETAELICGQDLGNAAKGAVQANEAYVSQYIDHKVLTAASGPLIVSRQNQPQAGRFPAIQSGALGTVTSFATDGYQFFGKEYVRTGIPRALSQEQLANEVYQYEFAYIALQSEKMQLTAPTEFVFYGSFTADHPAAVSEALVTEAELKHTFDNLPLFAAETATAGIVSEKQEKRGAVLAGEPLTDDEIEALFPERLFIEEENGQRLAFFTPEHHHVVLQEKELRMERSHGHILLSGTDLTVDRPLMSTTVYMNGLFNSQIVLGNTSSNKLMSNSRNALNAMPHSGQRIYLKEGGKWRMLGLASLFEMGLNSAVWYYKYRGDLLKIETYTVADGREIRTVFTSRRSQKYDILVTNHLLMSADETARYVLQKDEGLLTITAADDSVIRETYPELVYYLLAEQDYALTDETALGATVDEPELLGLLFAATPRLDVTIQGSLEGAPFSQKPTTDIDEKAAYQAFIDELLQGFQLSHPTAEVASFNTLARWYCHNMLVHYLSPHGLEQYGGAAWGTRDVSQGPVEFFLALERPEIVADIIEKLFANQFADDGNWPQWFMFDRYEKQKADESHGDVIVWPMKVVADYLTHSGDLGILETMIPYTDRTTFEKTSELYPLLDHVKKEVAYIEAHFLPGTYLSCYGDGDWDDTLQPNDARLKKQMASSWTVALTCQVIGKLAAVLTDADAEYAAHLKELAENIKVDYERYILSDEILPGFVLQEGDHFEFIIHPTDKKTGIDYRLLPMTRSMIAELLTPQQAENHLAVIKEQLQFPDGVRLMNRPARYNGGVSTYFKRAEQAANFGREIGLQYVHAHIRFTEAMAKLGKNRETWKALQTINPIGLQEHVANASLRQSNVYFSSSDGDFKTRYEAQENFDKLRDGSVHVKGGWRIYSSGPGIYLNQLLSNVLGIRSDRDHYQFDPVLPQELDQLVMDYRLADKKVTIRFDLTGGRRCVLLNGRELPQTVLDNPYRAGAMAVAKDVLKEQLKDDDEIVICS